MAKIPLSQRPLPHSMKFGFFSLLFSHLPIIIVFVIQWLRDKILPSFDFVFDSGRLISIWIPILGMLIISLYEVREFKNHPCFEEFSFVLILLLFIILTVLYTYFFNSQFEYASWMKWMTIGVVVLLYVFLVFSKYLEYSASGDLQGARAKDQDALDKKLSNLNSL